MGSTLVINFSLVEMGSMGLTHAADREAVLENRRRLAVETGVDPEQVTAAGAVHGTRIARVDQPAPLVEGVDGLVTDRPGLGLLATFADCYPLVLYDGRRPALALGHAGWRGTQAGMAGRLIEAMRREYGSDPGELHATIGPGICGSCYEVGPEFADRFPPAVLRPGRGGRLLLDLREANRLQLREAGVGEDLIHVYPECTFESERRFSHRRKPDGKRFAALVSFR